MRLYPARAIILALTCVAVPALAGDHFLTIGGGSAASNNQVSLEKNVLYLQRFLEAAGFSDVPHEILFSNGAAGTRDLQFFDPKASVPASTSCWRRFSTRPRASRRGIALIASHTCGARPAGR